MEDQQTPGVDLYAILGLTRTATQDDIKRAYRLVAMECHPDKTSDPAAHQRFKEVGYAYRVLSDPGSRASHDARRRPRISLEELHRDLAPRDLREFVDDLVLAHREDQRAREDFAARRAAELARRAEFDDAHPTLRDALRSVSPAPSSVAPAQPMPPPANPLVFGRPDPYPSLPASLPPSGGSTKAAMLEEFRRRRAAGSPDVPAKTAPALTPHGYACAAFPQGPDGAPLADTQVLKQTFGRFDYDDFESRTEGRPKPEERALLTDAILTDALGAYDFAAAAAAPREPGADPNT